MFCSSSKNDFIYLCLPCLQQPLMVVWGELWVWERLPIKWTMRKTHDHQEFIQIFFLLPAASMQMLSLSLPCKYYSSEEDEKTLNSIIRNRLSFAWPKLKCGRNAKHLRPSQTYYSGVKWQPNRLVCYQSWLEFIGRLRFKEDMSVYLQSEGKLWDLMRKRFFPWF